MKKGYIRILVFEIFVLFILLLNSFISNILRGYLMPLFLLILIILFRFIFGIEKDRHRYVKDIIYELLIILLMSFLIYYIFGIVIGFVRTADYYTISNMTKFVLPVLFTIILKEIFRNMVLTKSEGSKLLLVLTILLFVYLDITSIIPYTNFKGNYNIFIFASLTVLPAISNNIVCSYITTKVGYKPNILWLLVTNMYSYLLPIVPDTGDYILSIIRFAFPLFIGYRIYLFFEKEADKNVERDYKNVNKLSLVFATFVVIVLVYFTSGYFRYYAVAIASGSMTPNIYKGDVVIVEKIDNNFGKLKEGMVIAYKYEGVVIVHRIINIVEEDGEYFFYTKGDANHNEDNYVITEDMVVGTVNVRIPFAGYPTVWLNEL